MAVPKIAFDTYGFSPHQRHSLEDADVFHACFFAESQQGLCGHSVLLFHLFFLSATFCFLNQIFPSARVPEAGDSAEN